MTGRGRICWSSGTVYEGDFRGGFLHGSGTLFAVDGSVYEGSWRINIKHGVGTKRYSNSDVYEGFWREGMPEGTGKYTWSNGNTYIGNWKAGKMNGRGILKWANGNLFDGIWLDGYEHGSGYYKFADGSYYFGTWSRGIKDGQGTLYPAGSKLPKHQKYCDPNVYNYRKQRLSDVVINSGGSKNNRSNSKKNCPNRWNVVNCFRHSGRISHRPTSVDCVLDGGNSVVNMPSEGNVPALTCSFVDAQNEGDVVYDREYVQGVLIMERTRIHNPFISDKDKRKHKAEAKEKGPGETIYKGHKSYYLMLNLQLGIRYFLNFL